MESNIPQKTKRENIIFDVNMFREIMTYYCDQNGLVGDPQVIPVVSKYVEKFLKHAIHVIMCFYEHRADKDDELSEVSDNVTTPLKLLSGLEMRKSDQKTKKKLNDKKDMESVLFSKNGKDSQVMTLKETNLTALMAIGSQKTKTLTNLTDKISQRIKYIQVQDVVAFLETDPVYKDSGILFKLKQCHNF